MAEGQQTLVIFAGQLKTKEWIYTHSHTLQPTTVINQFGWVIVTYNQVLAPSDYHIFPGLKKHLDGIDYRTLLIRARKEDILHYLPMWRSTRVL